MACKYNFRGKTFTRDTLQGILEYTPRILKYQKYTEEVDSIIATEKTLRDLSERIADRIGMKVQFISDQTKKYKGRLIDANTAEINLAYATLDTPIHEILGHPIIKAIKTKEYANDGIYAISGVIENTVKGSESLGKFYIETSEYRGEDVYGDYKFFETKKEAEQWLATRKNTSQLYQNLLKELEYGTGKEVLDRIKKTYNKKDDNYKVIDYNNTFFVKEVINSNYSTAKSPIYKTRDEAENWININSEKYKLEEQQEEAIVELLGLYTAKKLDNVKDGKLISLLKRLLKEIKAFMKKLINQKEVIINELPDEMTIGDLSDLLAYSNSKLILPGYQVQYTTPDNQNFRTYKEASNHLADLAFLAETSLKTDLSTIKVGEEATIKIPLGVTKFENFYTGDSVFLDGVTWYTHISQYDPINETDFFLKKRISDEEALRLYIGYLNYIAKDGSNNSIAQFIDKNSQYEITWNTIKEWKRVNDIKYDPQEIYDRGQGFYSIVGAYSEFDVDLMFQNLLAHIEDNEKAGGEFTVSAFTRPVDRTLGHLEGSGGKIKFVIYPKSDDIKWASNKDVFSGSVWDASAKINKDKKSELLGVSYTKSPSSEHITDIVTNLGDVIDNLNHHHNELGITLTGGNFRLEYDDNIPYSTKKIIDGINKKLDQAYGKLNIVTVKAPSNITDINEVPESFVFEKTGDNITITKRKDNTWLFELESSIDEQYDSSFTIDESKVLEYFNKFGKGKKLKKETLVSQLKEIAEDNGYFYDKYNGNFIIAANVVPFDKLPDRLKNKVNQLYDKYNISIDTVPPLFTYKEDFTTYTVHKDTSINKFALSYIEDETGELIDGIILDEKTVIARAILYGAFKTYDTNADTFKVFHSINKIYEEEFNKYEKSKDAKVLVNKKIDILKSQAKKYPRVLIRSEVVPSSVLDSNARSTYWEDDDLPFQKLYEKEEATTKIKDKLKEFLTKAGFQLTNLDSYVASLESQGKSFDTDGVNALIDLTEGIIATNSGKDYDFIEEVAHLAVEMSPNDSRMERALELVVDTETYKKNVDGYTERYKQDNPNATQEEIDLKVKKEVLGKLIASHVFSNNRQGILNRLWQTLKGIWNNFMSKFKSADVKALNSFIKEVSDQLVAGNMEYFNSTPTGDVFFSLDKEKFKESDLLSNYKTELEQAIKTRIKKLKIYEVKGKKNLVDLNKKTIQELIDALDKDDITIGLINFINIAGLEINATLKRLNELEANYGNKTAKEIASELNHLNNYIAAYKPILSKIKGDLHTLTDKTDESKEIKNELSDLLDIIDTLESQYETLGIPIFAEVLFPFASKNPDIKTIDDLIKLLKQAPKDISFFQRFLDSMADSHDDVLAVIDQLVKVHKERGRIQTEDTKRELLDLDKKLKDNGIKNMEWIAEKDEKGNPTGRFISDRRYDLFKKELDKFLFDLRKKYGYSTTDAKQRELDQFNSSDALLKAYKKEQAQWFSKNTQMNPEAFDIIKAKLESIYEEVFDDFEKSTDLFNYIGNQIAPDIFTDKGVKQDNRKVTRVKDLFQEWLNDNRSWSDYQNDFYYKSQLTYPSKKYENKEFAKEMSNPIKKAYYDRVLEIKKSMDDKLPGFFINNLVMPQIKKDFLERAKKSPKKAIKELKENFTDAEDDTEFGMPYKLVDERNRPVQFLPVFFTRLLKDTSDLSLDITATMTAYVDMANNYDQMNQIIDVLELGDEILAKRDIAVGTDVLSKSVALFKGEKALAERTGGKSYDRFKDYMSMIVYGKMKEDEKWLASFGLNTAKVVDTFNMYTAIQGLGLNLYSAVANPILGNALVRQERIAKEFIKPGSLSFADKTYTSELGTLLGDIGSLQSNSKLRLFGEYLDILQDHKARIHHLNADRGIWGRMFNTSTLFFLNHAGEHQIQFRTALAMAHGKELLLNGKTINLWDAFEAKDNRLFIREGVTNMDGSDFTFDDVSQFGLKVQRLNQKLHGIYNEIDRSAVQKWALGRTGVLFRKFIKPGINRRFEDKHFNYSLEAIQEGSYVSTARFMKTLYNELKGGQLSIAKNWEKLEPYEKANVKRTITEVSYMLAVSIFAGILTNLSGDDDDNWALNMAAYQANRIYTELRFYTSPNEALKILKSPAAGINQLQTLMGYFNVFDPFGAMLGDDPFLRTYKGGKNEGSTYLWVTTKRSFVPTLKNIENWFIPEEQLKMFIQ